MNDQKHIDDLPDISLPNVERIRTSEKDFIDDLIEASNTTRVIIVICANLIPDPSIKKIHQGILTGHMVRIYKLYDTFVFLLSQNRMEVAIIFIRLIVDTIFNFFYLIKKKNDKLFEKFVKSSLAYDKKLYDEINKKKHQPLLPIEERMLKSIENTINQNGYNIADINFEKDKNWHGYNIFALATKLNLLPLYEYVFRTTSGSIHGNWYEMETYHLEETEKVYQPILEYHTPKPQIITCISILVLEVTKIYVNKIYKYDTENTNLLMKALNDLEGWYKAIDELHENFINASV